MSHPLQPDHLQEDTLVLLVHGWKSRATFPPGGTREKLAELEAALTPTGGVFVVAQSLVYVNGQQDVVLGLPVASADADSGPAAFSLASVRAIERRTELAFDADTRARLGASLDEPLAGPPNWLLVPTGALASGYCAHGALVETPEDDDDAADGRALVTGCDMSQERHGQSVRGTELASAFDWDVEAVDLSAERTALLGEGEYFLIARYD